MIDPKWANIIGLILDVAGAVFLTYGLLISKKGAIELGVARWSGGTDEEKMKLPAVRDRVRQSRNALVGMFLLVIGFVLQIYGSWPR